MAKWKGADWGSVERIPADALTIDLKTSSNTLSFWKADGEDSDGEDAAILAIIATLQRAETVHVAIIDERDLEHLDIRESPETATTAAVGFNRLHVDILELDDASVRTVAAVIAKYVYAEETRRITASKVKRLIREGVEGGIIDVERLPSSLRRHVNLD